MLASSGCTGIRSFSGEPGGELFDSDCAEEIDVRANPTPPRLAGLAPRLRQ